MLNKGLRDERKQEISDVFGKILEWEFVPAFWEKEQREKLDKALQKVMELTLNEIEDIPVSQLLNNLKKHHFEFDHYEQFGDILMQSIPLEAEEKQQNLAKKAVAVYESAQTESKTFSFSLIQKINQAKTWESN